MQMVRLGLNKPFSVLKNGGRYYGVYRSIRRMFININDNFDYSRFNLGGYFMKDNNLECKVKGCKGKLIIVTFAGKVRCECDRCGTIIYQTDRAYKDED